MKRRALIAAACFCLTVAFTEARAEKKYDTGASDTEIRIGNLMPYTGVFSEYGATGRAEAAYFQMINDQGGIHGRKLTYISLDSGSDLAKALPLAQQLVEKEQVLLTVGTWGAPFNLAIRPYLNDKKVPQLFVADTDAAMDDPAHFPWTMGFQPSKRTEGAAYANYLLKNRPDAKIAILCGNAPTDQEWVESIRATGQYDETKKREVGDHKEWRRPKTSATPLRPWNCREVSAANEIPVRSAPQVSRSR